MEVNGYHQQKGKYFRRVLVNKQLMVAIGVHSKKKIHIMEVNGYHQQKGKYFEGCW